MTLPNADDPRERKEMRGVVTRAAMKNMTIPQAKVFALEVELYTDKYVQQLTTKASLQRAIDELTAFNLPQYDHSKCIDKRTCIGYENAQSDFDNEKELRLNELQAELHQAEKEGTL